MQQDNYKLQLKTNIKEILLENNFIVENFDNLGKIEGAFGLKILLNEQNINWVGIIIPNNYPYEECSLYIDKSNFFKIPHVEENGKLCLGIKYHLGDEKDIISQIRRSFLIFSELLNTVAENTQKNEEFKKEIMSWWKLFAAWHEKKLKKVSYLNNYIIKPELEDCGFCLLSTYGSRIINKEENNIPGFKNVQIIANIESKLPLLKILNKNFNNQMSIPPILKGNGIFIKLPNEKQWGENEWPKNFDNLEKILEDFNALEAFELFMSSSSKKSSVKDIKNYLIYFFEQLGIKEYPNLKQVTLLKNIMDSSKDFIIVFEHNNLLFGYQIEINKKLPFYSHRVSPISNLDRIDTTWLINRGSNKSITEIRENKKILIIGLGAIGGNLVNLLVKSGIKNFTLVDKDILKPENITRHQLGIDSCGYSKVISLKKKMEESFPLVEIQYETDNIQNLPWTSIVYKEKYDLIIDCSAEQSVRSFLWKNDSFFYNVPKIHIWLEPFCLAGHVAVVYPNEPWPKDKDPIDSIINASNVSIENTEIKTPFCGGSFSPYEISDVNQVTALASQVILKSLDINLENESYVTSLVKNIFSYNEKELYEDKYNIRDIVSRDKYELQRTLKRSFKYLKLTKEQYE